jgi:hypothetical protein
MLLKAERNIRDIYVSAIAVTKRQLMVAAFIKD